MLKEDINKFFDNIYCINLDNRKDRWSNTSKSAYGGTYQQLSATKQAGK
jgi:hypothetical protein